MIRALLLLWQHIIDSIVWRLDCIAAMTGQGRDDE